MRQLPLSVILSAVVLSSSSQLFAETTYTVKAISLTGTAYENGGSASFGATNAAGDVVGTSTRTDGSGEVDGWYYNAASGSTDRIGLAGNGYATDSFYGTLGGGGYVVGTSTTADYSGTAAWIFNANAGPAGTTTAITVTLPAGTSAISSSGGYSYTVTGASAAGQAAGTVSLYDSTGAYSGNTAWYYDLSKSATAFVIGLSNAPAGSYSQVSAINSSGVVLGGTSTYGAVSTSDAWIYNPSTNTTQTIELSTPYQAGITYTSTSGNREVSASLMNDAGVVAGTSVGYSGDNFIGTVAWVYTPNGSTVQIGLDTVTPGGNYSASDYRSSDPVYVSYSNLSALNAAGQVTGSTSRYVNGQEAGSDSFLYTPGKGTTFINVYTSSIYTKTTDGSRDSSPSLLSAAGQVAGTVTRYNNSESSNYAGQDAWYYNGKTAVVIAPVGSVYIGQAIAYDLSFNQIYVDNGRSSGVSAINNTGLVAGYSTRYLLGTSTTVGQDAWVYDSNNDPSGSGVPSVISGLPGQLSPDGFTQYSVIAALSDSGVAVGYYSKFAGDGTSVDEAFAWEDGVATDLNLIVDPTLPSAEWESLLEGLAFDGAGNIIGLAQSSDGSQVAVLLTSSAVPEPASLSVLGVAATGLLLRRRR